MESITFSIDKGVFARASEWAQARGTTVEALVLDYLAQMRGAAEFEGADKSQKGDATDTLGNGGQ